MPTGGGSMRGALHRVAVWTGGAAVTLATVAVAGAGAPAADAATCKADLTLLSRAPISTYTLNGGAAGSATVRIWDTGRPSTASRGVRIAVVRIPSGSLTPGIITSPTLSRAATPASMAAHDPSALVVINADHFNPTVGGIPYVDEMARGVIRKMASATGNDPWQFGLAVYPGTKQIINASARLYGVVSSTAGRVAITGLNWQTVRPSGITVYNATWGGYPHPYGARTVIVTGGKVVAIRTGTSSRLRPATGQSWLTAPAGTAAATYLAKLRVGNAVSVTYRLTGNYVNDGVFPHTPIGSPTGFVGTGGFLLYRGANRSTCTARNEIARPRSAIAWAANGDVLVASVSNPYDGGARMGGATVRQWADALRRLGAVTAVNLDGGTSTTLLVRRTSGGALVRLDEPMSAYMRPVVNAFAFHAS